MDKFDLNVKFSYPYSEEFFYETYLERINLDEEREEDIQTDNGFIISPYKGIKKDLKDPFSIFSIKFGQGLKDLNPFADRYKCECGRVMNRINNKTKCPVCGKEVRYVDDNFQYFGWIVLKSHYIMHPNLFKSIEFLIGKDFKNIIAYDKSTDEDGHERKYIETPKDQPFYNIGMVEFYKRFDEVLAYYLNKNPNKKEYYDDIMANRDKVWTQSIPVFTTLLRPFLEDQKTFSYEDSNDKYNMMNRYATELNRDKLAIEKTPKFVAKQLESLQLEYNKLYASIEAILSGKKGQIRQLLGGRCNFTSRDVIVANPKLRIDEVTLPYKCLIELLQQQIINILTKIHGYTYDDAYNRWYKANIEPDNLIKEIILSIINANKEQGKKGIPILINRNPTIQFGSILQMFVVGMTMDFTMAIPLQILPLLAADFDGDVLNIMLIINEAFYIMANRIFNPRNSMYISRNDGRFNNSVNHQRDVLINSNSIIRIGRDNYSDSEMGQIRHIQEKWSKPIAV